MTREQQAEVARSMTGSQMSTHVIVANVLSFDPVKKATLCPEIHRMVKDNNIPFDKAFPLIKDGFNEIAQNNSIDPSVLFWVYMDWLRDYNQRK